MKDSEGLLFLTFHASTFLFSLIRWHGVDVGRAIFFSIWLTLPYSPRFATELCNTFDLRVYVGWRALKNAWCTLTSSAVTQWKEDFVRLLSSLRLGFELRHQSSVISGDPMSREIHEGLIGPSDRLLTTTSSKTPYVLAHLKHRTVDCPFKLFVPAQGNFNLTTVSKLRCGDDFCWWAERHSIRDRTPFSTVNEGVKTKKRNIINNSQSKVDQHKQVDSSPEARSVRKTLWPNSHTLSLAELGANFEHKMAQTDYFALHSRFFWIRCKEVQTLFCFL